MHVSLIDAILYLLILTFLKGTGETRRGGGGGEGGGKGGVGSKSFYYRLINQKV